MDDLATRAEKLAAECDDRAVGLPAVLRARYGRYVLTLRESSVTLRALVEENRRLREAFSRFGLHAFSCAINHGVGGCTCGFDSAMAATAGDTEEEG